MDGSCQHKAFCSCRFDSEIIDYVKNRIESCIKKFMSLEETVDHLLKNYQISHNLTRSTWEQLERESPIFFKKYYLRCKVAWQTKMFNDMLAKQVSQMIELGNIDICYTSPAILTFLTNHPEGIRLLDKLANTSCYKTMANSASLAASGAYGSSVTQFQIPPHDQQNQLQPYQRSTYSDLSYNHLVAPTLAPEATDLTALMQLQIPNDQQNQLPPCPSSTLTYLDYDYPGALTVAATATDQWCTSVYPTYNELGAPSIAPAATDHWCTSTDPALVTQLQIPNGQQNQLHHDPCSTFSDLDYDYIVDPTVAPAATDPAGNHLEAPTTDHWCTSTNPADDKWSSSDEHAYIGAPMLDHPSTFGLGGDIGYNGLGFQDKDLDAQAHDLMQSDEQLKDRSGQHQPQFQPQQNFPLEEQRTLAYEESLDQLWRSFDTDQSTPANTSIDQQQAGGVKRRHPESEALNNP